MLKLDGRKRRNNVLLRAIQSKAKHVKEFCDHFKLHPVEMGKFVCLKKSPIRLSGKWRELALRLAEIFECLPEELFPLELYQTRREINFSELSDRERHRLNSIASDQAPEEDMHIQQLGKELKAWFFNGHSRLTDVEKRCLIMFYGLDDGEEKEDSEIASAVGVTKRSVRQHVYDAVQKLKRNHSFIKSFADFC